MRRFSWIPAGFRWPAATTGCSRDRALRETLAAAILLSRMGRNPAEAFVGPMCGSGTLAIEAAWIAQRRAPGWTATISHSCA